jgi:hypothetical protein
MSKETKSGTAKKSRLTLGQLKDKLTDDYLDLSLCSLDYVPVKEIVKLDEKT